MDKKILTSTIGALQEGKVVVCMVLRIDKERGHIDLSLRRVTDMQRKTKINEMKLEQIAA